MGLWTGIKYALNSTLGTSGFKPIDQLISDNRGCIKSVQRGTITISGNAIYNTATISPVTLNRAILIYSGIENSKLGDFYKGFLHSSVRMSLTTTTTVRAYIGTAGESLDSITVSFQVIEFY